MDDTVIEVAGGCLAVGHAIVTTGLPAFVAVVLVGVIIRRLRGCRPPRARLPHRKEVPNVTEPTKVTTEVFECPDGSG